MTRWDSPNHSLQYKYICVSYHKFKREITFDITNKNSLVSTYAYPKWSIFLLSLLQLKIEVKTLCIILQVILNSHCTNNLFPHYQLSVTFFCILLAKISGAILQLQISPIYQVFEPLANWLGKHWCLTFLWTNHKNILISFLILQSTYKPYEFKKIVNKSATQTWLRQTWIIKQNYSK
jgi:hypothetical protein